MKIHEKEVEEGNIEYKQFFENITFDKLVKLTAQMNWRINEGNCISYYYLGICDDGTICTDFSQERLDYSLDIIKMMADGCNAFIDQIIINHVSSHVWLNIVVKRMIQYTAEYRILVKCPNIMRLFPEYLKTGETSYHMVQYNNEKYLFFESTNEHIVDLIDFNIILTTNKYDTIEHLMENMLPHMRGNIIPNKKNIVFNIIEKHIIPSMGIILYGFLKDGYIEKNSIINNEWIIYSIHYNMVDCKNIVAPATVSLCVRARD